jgi:hypothetical protein
VKSRNAVVMVGGDFNYPGWNWKDRTLCRNSPQPGLHHIFMDSVRDLGLEQLVEKPTRGDNTLDLMLTNFPNMVPRVEIIPGVSDHQIVYLELQMTPVKERQIQRPVPCYNKADWDSMREAASKLSDTILASHNHEPNAEEIWVELRDGLKDIVQEFVPHRTLGQRHAAPWIDYKSKKLIRRRNRIHKLWLKTKSKPLLQEYKSLKRTIQQRLRRKYWQYLESTITEDSSGQARPKQTVLGVHKTKENRELWRFAFEGQW